jgi:uncharacterized protein YcfJ
MIEKSLAVISNKTRRGSRALIVDLRNSFRLERSLEKNSLAVKRKLVEERDRTLKALALRSRQQEKDKTEGVGGALGLLGGGLLGRRFFGRGSGGILRGRFGPRVPSSPSQLLRMQRGASNLSRVSRVGRLGRVGPLAVLGTGLDFAGRKAEGQTNLQAGLGAGGGLAGALAGAKYGAILGTAIGGPIGTLIGGVGGSIIGGLAGGKLADLFSGADRRRKFEEQRVAISTQKTLFSSALDDLDRVLDKLEGTSPFLMIKRDDDELPERRFPFRVSLPKLPKPKGRGRIIGEEIAKYLAIAGLTFVLIPTDFSDLATTAPAAAKLTALVRSTRLFKFLKPLFAKPEVFLKPGKEIPAISEKGLRIRAEAFLKKLNPKIKFDKKPKREPSLNQLLKKEKELQEKLYQIIKNASPEKAMEIFQKFIKKGDLKVPRNILKKGDVKVNPKRQFPSGSPDMTGTNSNPLGGGTPLSMNEFEPTDNNNIALAPINNILLLNQDDSTQSTTQKQGGNTILIGGGTSDPFAATLNMAQIEILQTA